MTFLDNHDQRERFYFSSPDAPDRFAHQLTLGIGCLLSLQGIPCLYYGTEQGLHGRGSADMAVREALWGKPNPFSRNELPYTVIARLAAVRGQQPALRYGRQYFRPISGDGIHFGISPFAPGVLAFSRILNEEEVLVVANTNTQQEWSGEVIIDRTLNPVGSIYTVLFSNQTDRPSGALAPGSVAEKASGHVEIHEVNGAVTAGPAHALPVSVRPMEIQILCTA